MKAEQIFENKSYLDVFDIMNLFECGEAKAYSIIRAIKAVSSTIPIKGKVAQIDYERWIRGGSLSDREQ